MHIPIWQVVFPHKYLKISLTWNKNHFSKNYEVTSQAYTNIAITDDLHAQVIYDCIKNHSDKDQLPCDRDIGQPFLLFISLHIPCNRTSSDIHSMKNYDLYLSDVDDQCVSWVVDIVKCVGPTSLTIPRSSLSTLFTWIMP